MTQYNVGDNFKKKQYIVGYEKRNENPRYYAGDFGIALDIADNKDSAEKVSLEKAKEVASQFKTFFQQGKYKGWVRIYEVTYTEIEVEKII